MGGHEGLLHGEERIATLFCEPYLVLGDGRRPRSHPGPARVGGPALLTTSASLLVGPSHRSTFPVSCPCHAGSPVGERFRSCFYGKRKNAESIRHTHKKTQIPLSSTHSNRLHHVARERCGYRELRGERETGRTSNIASKTCVASKKWAWGALTWRACSIGCLRKNRSNLASSAWGVENGNERDP